MSIKRLWTAKLKKKQTLSLPQKQKKISNQDIKMLLIIWQCSALWLHNFILVLNRCQCYTNRLQHRNKYKQATVWILNKITRYEKWLNSKEATESIACVLLLWFYYFSHSVILLFRHSHKFVCARWGLFCCHVTCSCFIIKRGTSF